MILDSMINDAKAFRKLKEMTDQEIAEEAKKWGLTGLFSERQFVRSLIQKAEKNE